MEKIVYPWRRFWYPLGERPAFYGEDYFFDPEELPAFAEVSRVRSLDQLGDVPCLILLGEPGSGKTHALEAERRRVERRLKQQEEQLRWVDLRGYGEEGRLERHLFEHDSLKRWAEGTEVLHLYLDSLDECLLHISVVAELLSQGFERFSGCLDRIRLRIACRAAEWPRSLGQELFRLWGGSGEKVRCLELAPLMRKDVALAAKHFGLPAPEEFLLAIDSAEARPLAIKPTALEFLLRTYREKGSFPTRRSELYLRGCRLLAEELSESRREAKYLGNLSADQRLAVACRLAALLMFCNKAAIRAEPDRGDAPEDDIGIESCIGGHEPVGSDLLQVGEREVREVLETALFASRGAGRFGFAHQTFAEFLAARYLEVRNHPIQQVKSLLFMGEDTDRRVVPQLAETAAWLAAKSPEVQEAVFQADPEILLSSDASSLGGDLRKRLVDALFQPLERDALVTSDFRLWRGYSRLGHPDLAAQLRPYLLGSKGLPAVQREAIAIAGRCRLGELQGELLTIALDTTKSEDVRREAVWALGEAGEPATKSRLLPLARGEAGSDPEDELKAAALYALWPGTLSLDELFALLTPPKQPEVIAGYSSFLSHWIGMKLPEGELPMALRHACRIAERELLSQPFNYLLEDLLAKAAGRVTEPGVCSAFVDFLVTLSKLDHGDVPGPARRKLASQLAVPEVRRGLLEEVVRHPSQFDPVDVVVVLGAVALLPDEDFPWLVQRAVAATEPVQAERWAVLSRHGFRQQRTDHREVLLVAVGKSQAVRDAFQNSLASIALRADQGEEPQVTRDRPATAQEQSQPPPQDAPAIGEVRQCLSRCEAGDADAWWQLTLALLGRRRSGGAEFAPDLTKRPGWVEADQELRARILTAGALYVELRGPGPGRILAPNSRYRPAAAGYQALCLLAKEAPAMLRALQSSVWERWAHEILGYPEVGEDDPTRRSQGAIACMAYQQAPEHVLRSVETLVHECDREHSDLTFLARLESCWDHRLEEFLLQKAGDKKLSPRAAGSILEILLTRNPRLAAEIGNTFLQVPVEIDVERRNRALVAAKALLLVTEDGGWSAIRPILDQDTSFGQSLLGVDTCADFIGRHSHQLQRLHEQVLADMYLILKQESPVPEEKDRRLSQEANRRLQSRLLRRLRDCGTAEACRQLERVARERPDDRHPGQMLPAARQAARRSAWQPPTPAQLFELTATRTSRLVRGAGELLEVVIESLNRLGRDLQGKPPAAHDLWAGNRPKEEGMFCDYLKRHLDRDLKQRVVVALREVQVEQGEETDLYVVAPVQDARQGAIEQVTVIVETKGSWNKDVKSDMKTQLVDRYLANNSCQHGLYVVGWFRCDRWDQADDRWKRHRRWTLEAARSELEEQARSLSQGGLVVRSLVLDARLREPSEERFRGRTQRPKARKGQP